jgi:DNA-binding CsgD family transcriptional regulator
LLPDAHTHRRLQRALAVGIQPGSLATLQRLTAEWLDRSPAAVVFLDLNRRTVFRNLRAEALCSQGDGIQLRANGIALAHKQDDDRLQGLIARALSPTNSPPPADTAMRAERPSGKRPYIILVTPANGAHPVSSSVQPAVSVTIIDPEHEDLPPVGRLREAFGLTEAEGRLASLLTTGAELREAAAKLGITYGTARARLTQIFQKTGTRRQAALMRLLLGVLNAP